MHYHINDYPENIIYKLLTATITPRPIAWVTSCDANGHINAAPFSFFNIMGNNPPLAVFSVMKPSDRIIKDTAANILQTKEFVVNLVPFSLAQQMNITAMEAPHGFDELAAANLTTRPSQHIKVPQIAQSPVSFECIDHATMETGENQYLVIGKVIAIYIDDIYIIDSEKGYVDTPRLELIGRMHGRGTYLKPTDLFNIDRIDFKSFQDHKEN